LLFQFCGSLRLGQRLHKTCVTARVTRARAALVTLVQVVVLITVPAVLLTMVPAEPAIADPEVLRTRNQVVHDTMAPVLLHILVPVELATRGRAERAIQDQAAEKGVQQFADEETVLQTVSDLLAYNSKARAARISAEISRRRGKPPVTAALRKQQRLEKP